MKTSVPRLRVLKSLEPTTLPVAVFGKVVSLEKSPVRFNGTIVLVLNFFAPKLRFGPHFLLQRSFFVLEILLTVILGILALAVVLILVVVLALEPLLPVVLVHQAIVHLRPVVQVPQRAAVALVHLLVPPVVLVAQLLAALVQVVVLLALLGLLRAVEAAAAVARLVGLALALVVVVVLNSLTFVGVRIKKIIL